MMQLDSHPPHPLSTVSQELNKAKEVLQAFVNKEFEKAYQDCLSSAKTWHNNFKDNLKGIRVDEFRAHSALVLQWLVSLGFDCLVTDFAPWIESTLHQVFFTVQCLHLNLC